MRRVHASVPLCSLHAYYIFFFSSRRRHTRLQGDWSSDVCSSDLEAKAASRCACRRSPYLGGLVAVNFILLLAVPATAFSAEAALRAEIRTPAASQIGRASCRERV